MLQEYLEATSTDGNLICLAGEAIINLCTWYFDLFQFEIRQTYRTLIDVMKEMLSFD
jgi:hypothetical protein